MSREDSQSSAVRSVWRGLSASSSLEDALTGRYEALRDIARGSFAKVILARHILTGTKVAVKVLQKVNGDCLPFVVSELDILRGVEHPHVVRLLEIIDTPGTTYVVMEHMAGGPLARHIPEAVGLCEEEARGVFRQVASALGYCHGQGIAHRDLKADNVLLDGAGGAKLCDFGLACRFSAGEKLGVLCGTMAYWAPELFQGTEYDGPAVDVWSMGVLLFLMLTGCLPFTGASFLQAKEQVLQARYDLPSRLSAEVQNLVAGMLTVESTHRPTLQQLLGHLWLSQGEQRTPSPSAELLPRRPDTSILLAMLDLGYGLQETWVSVSTRRFNEAMGTYLLLHHQKTQGADCKVRVKPGRPQVGPCPSPSNPSSLTLDPRRSARGPALRSWPLWVHQQLLPEEHKPWGQRGSPRASLPNIPLCHVRASTPTVVPVSPLPCCCLSKSSQALASDPSSNFTEQYLAATRTPGRPRDTARGWRGVIWQVAACLARLCCCIQAPRTGPGGPNGVVPEPGGRTPPPALTGPATPHHGGQAHRRIFRNRVRVPWPMPTHS
ncbi:sperm motility kinase 2B-like [Sciurus carolinensis]|uniref:sperm motility kinase 2B-like n=1 Tax=Sciurus carolinensis TaxID=30640 RepID=UPI001FB381D6|nr:sperm motility kinase 2B-like [Sciurus carolinensis]